MLYSVPETIHRNYMSDSLSTILVADDHPLFREAMCDVAKDAFPGVNILEASNFAMVAELLSQNDTMN